MTWSTSHSVAEYYLGILCRTSWLLIKHHPTCYINKIYKSMPGSGQVATISIIVAITIQLWRYFSFSKSEASSEYVVAPMISNIIINL